MEKCFKFNINIQYLAMSLFALVVHDAPLCPAATPATSHYYCQSVPLNSPYNINNTSNTITAATQQSNTMISNSNNTVLLMPSLLATQLCQHWFWPHSQRISCPCSTRARCPSYQQHLTIYHTTTTLSRILNCITN